MLYLEDFMDSIELLPVEVRNSMTRVGELDRQIGVSMNQVQHGVDTLFKNANNIKPVELEAGFMAMMKEGEKSVVKSEQKIQIVNRMQKILTKYVNQLDADIQSCKIELECNNSGVTEMIEKKVSDNFDNCNITILKENKYKLNNKDLGGIVGNLNDSDNSTFTASNSGNKVSRTDRVSNVANSLKVPISTNYTLNRGEAITLPVAVTVTSNQQVHGIPIASTSKTPMQTITVVNQKKPVSFVPSKFPVNKKCISPSTSTHKSNQNQTKTPKKRTTTRNAPTSTDKKAQKEKSVTNEPRYCICNLGAFDDMVACDNAKCPKEWFHYGCVGIIVPPEGSWYCPLCVSKTK